MQASLWPLLGPTAHERGFWNSACSLSPWTITKCIPIQDFLIRWPKVIYKVMTFHWNAMEKSNDPNKSGHNGLWPGHKAWLCFNFKISIPWAPLRQTITSFDSWPLQGHFRSQVYSHSVATWRISFGRHIRLEFRHCAHLPDRLRRFPTINDKYDISRSNLTLTLWPWLELKFWPGCFYVNMHVFRWISTWWDTVVLSISLYLF